MTEFLDVVQFHKNEKTGKWRRMKLGYAKQGKNPGTWDVYLDALPMPGPDGCRITLQPQQDRPQQARGFSGGRLPDDDPDAIPF